MRPDIARSRLARHGRWGLFLASLFATASFAQDFRFGVKAGVPATAYFETGSFGASRLGLYRYSAATRRYTVGLSAEMRFDAVGFEFDVLYKRMGYVQEYSCDCPPVLSSSIVDVKGNSWDVPLLLKYRLGRLLAPYLAGGAVLRRMGPLRGLGERRVQDLVARTTTITPVDTSRPSDLTKRSYAGLSVAVGIEAPVGRVRLQPEFRYTRWVSDIPIEGNFGALRLPPSQAEFLLGLLF